MRSLLTAALLSLSILPLASQAQTASGSALAAPLAASKTVISLQRHDAGTFYVAGNLEGYGDLRMLVDTGSSYLVINEDVLAQLKAAGIARPTRELDSSLADGTRRIIPVYSLSTLRIGDSCWIHDVEAAVIPGRTRPILGMNILARLAPFTFSADPAELVVTACQQQQAPATTASAGITGVGLR